MPTAMDTLWAEIAACRHIDDIPARRWTVSEMIFFSAMESYWGPDPISRDVDVLPEGSDGHVETREKRIIVTAVGLSMKNGPGTGTDMP